MMLRSKLVLAIRDLLWRWWCVDQIRVSPAVGRLLRLHVGSLVSIEGRDYEIVARNVENSGWHSAVAYECVQGDVRGVLLVKSTTDEGQGLSVCWNSDGRSSVLREEDVQVWR